ncbi:hypothetical protein [Fluviibacter phosphoraccumulans]|uniref:Uncharacterized protein n=1 Tax=Fluviibacter phosphoraccumulans TaxID=1751046 RepID=A0A679HU96_9RHOO|nr:hypothetical protein [Fluviibacter phosphoraccumulans]BBU70048.1 hypothetical protein ICHIAU1_23310 [Fluviibacter phosphoraccumulans]BBU70760.1 hypothetical protein ICHIJ1_06790 [Fluviibacter phosphoraccumulans]BCA65886.1 hypothetical protein SHINM1_014880 [Fluviibacter phosphoraccumulans]
MNERNEMLMTDIQTGAAELVKLLDGIKAMTRGHAVSGLVDMALTRSVELENDCENLVDSLGCTV